MLSNDEFMRQRAAKLKTDEQKKQQNKDYQSDNNIMNRRLDDLDKEKVYKYKKLISRYKIIFYLSLPVCLVIAFCASLALVLMGVIRTKMLLILATLIIFIFLYALIVSLIITGKVKKEEEKESYEQLKEKIRAEVMKEIEKEYDLVRKSKFA